MKLILALACFVPDGSWQPLSTDASRGLLPFWTSAGSWPEDGTDGIPVDFSLITINHFITVC